MKQLLIYCFLAVSLPSARSQDVLSADAFRVLPESAEGPSSTPYLRYQTEVAWRQDDERRKQGNIKLASVASDALGVSAMKMLRALAPGETHAERMMMQE